MSHLLLAPIDEKSFKLIIQCHRISMGINLMRKVQVAIVTTPLFAGDLTQLGLVINTWIFNDLFFMSVSSSNCRLSCVSVYACVCAENVG